MRLEIADFPVRKIYLGNSHRYQGGTLEVDREDLVRLVLQDRRIHEARFDTASPGEPVRITGIRDVAEPRELSSARRSSLSRNHRAGAGRWRWLRPIDFGDDSSSTAAYEGTIRAGTGVQRSAILDMWGRVLRHRASAL